MQTHSCGLRGRLLRSTLFFMTLGSLTGTLQAETTATLASPQARAEHMALHTNPHWLSLGHYRPAIWGGYLSQADDSAFFLSQQGRQSPEEELKATLNALLQPPTGDDRHASCRFPARDAWLRQQLSLPSYAGNCPALSHWMNELRTQTVTLVFAASYLNSPSSMFGHTLLRLDPPQDKDAANLLLASTISYSADAAAHDSELLFAYRGIFGGYPGITTVQPYYEKIRLYSDIENRDLWEYQLNLDTAETRRLLQHTWEIRDKRFDYYFFDENCAYRLLALIDIARPGTRLLDEVTTHAIPSDTVRWVLKHNLISRIHYRPSSATSITHVIQQLSETEQPLTLALTAGKIAPNDPALTSLPKKQQARVLDASYDYLQYRAVKDQWPREQTAPRSYALLTRRAQITEDAGLQPPPRPGVRDDQGHSTLRVGLQRGQDQQRDFIALDLRPAYHDLLDPPEGYRSGAQLQFLQLDTRYYQDNDELQLQRLTAIEIRSLSARNDFFAPLSWQVGFGARRQRIENGKSVLSPYLDGGAGYAWAFGRGLASLMSTADLVVDDDIGRGFDLAPGLDLGILQQHRQLSLTTGLRSKAWVGDGLNREDQLYLQTGWHLASDYKLSSEILRSHHFERYSTQWQIGLHAYF